MNETVLKQYNKDFYGENDLYRIEQGRIVLNEFFRFFKPETMIDFGCGLGHWLYSAKKYFDVRKIKGVDGNFVDEKCLLIDRNEFVRHDFETPFVYENGKYDLAISIETAEHISPENSDNIIEALTHSSDIVLFSAAPPFQGGVHHVNMNAPAYWANKFKKQGFVCFDFMRDILWNIENINCIYPQNILVFVKETVKKQLFEEQGFKAVETPLLRYHPGFVAIIVNNMQMLSQNSQNEYNSQLIIEQEVKKVGLIKKVFLNIEKAKRILKKLKE